MRDRDNTCSSSFDEFQSLHQFLLNTQNAFFMYDRYRSGYLTADKVFRALTYAGKPRGVARKGPGFSPNNSDLWYDLDNLSCHLLWLFSVEIGRRAGERFKRLIVIVICSR